MVHPKPIVYPLIAIDVVHPSTIPFHEKTFSRPYRIMVQADPIIAICFKCGAPAIAKHLTRQSFARPVKPFYLIPQIGDQALGPMDAQLFVNIKERLKNSPLLA